MAVGVNIRIEFIEELQSYFHEAIVTANSNPAYEKKLEVATYLELEEITPQFMDEFSLLQPFGQENPEPFSPLGISVLDSAQKSSKRPIFDSF